MGALENPRHEMYVQELIKGASQRVAYRSAFPNAIKWKDATVDNRASELFHNSEILGRYQELQAEATSKTIKTAIQRKEWLSSIMDDETEDISIKLKACDLLNKMDGEYTTKIEADVNSEVNINIELIDE
jgi:hypothetical protein